MLKLLILKFVKNVKVNVVMRQHDIWCVRAFCVKMCAGKNARTHTRNVMLPHHHIDFYILTNFKISNFNKEHVSSLKMI